MKSILGACVIILAGVASAIAGPEGTYAVTGTNPGGNGTYKGTVSVTRTGETYEVVWNISGTRYVGSALGAAPVKGVTVMGPADPSDDTLAVGYVSGKSFGLAFYVEQKDGTWDGVWTYGGSDKVGTESWRRK